MGFNCFTFVVFSHVALFSSAFFLNKNKNEGNTDTLILLHVLFRHGERTRDIDTYPNDPYINETFYPYGYGQLVNRGKVREYDIGKYLRKTYGKFLGELYTPYVLDARSTDFNRTKMSLELVLASLYPPQGRQIWLPGLQWQPIPYNYWKPEEDYLLGDTNKNCPVYHNQLHNYVLSSEGMMVFRNDSDLYSYLSENTGMDITDPSGPYSLYFQLSTEEEWGLKLPAWTENVWPEKITEAASKQFVMLTGTDTLKKFSGGFLLKKIIDDTYAKIEGKLLPQERKIFLYSAHERNVGVMLRTLGVYDRLHVPPYGSFITFEIHRIKETHGVKVYYQDYRKTDPHLLKIPGCSEFCELRKFESLMKNFLPSSERECNES